MSDRSHCPSDLPLAVRRGRLGHRRRIRPVPAACAKIVAPAVLACLVALAASAQGTDRTAPNLASQSVDWTRLKLTFSEALDEDSVPAASAFTVLVGGTARTLAGVSVSADASILALTLPVAPTDAVTVAYEAPTEGRLQDEAGNAVASFAATSAANETPTRLATQGPGLGNLHYSEAESFQPVSWIRDLGITRGNPSKQYGTNSGILLNGYFVTVFAHNGDDGAGGGFLVYDVSDPRNIRRIRRIEALDGATGEFREQHSMPAARIGDSIYVAIQSSRGIEIWDLTDIDDIHRESRLGLPGVRGGDYDHVAWQASWKAPYLYVATASRGIYIVDVSDPAAPFIADRGHRRPNPVPPAEYGGFRAGPVFAMGNHLVVTSMDNSDGWSSLDIGNPLNPVLLATLSITASEKYYSTCFDGRRIYSAPRRGADDRTLVAFDLTDPASFVLANDSLKLVRRLYCATQDHFLFQGGRDDFKKIDIGDDSDWVEVGTGTLGVEEDPDNGQISPMGNLVYVGNDDGTGSAFFPHDTDPDLTPPEVIQVSPRNGAANQPLTTSVGVAFTDSVLLESVDADRVRLLDAEGDTVNGTYGAYLGIVNFSPAEPLEPSTTYTVQVPAGGVSDYAGNRVGTGFRSTFTTTAELPVEPVHRWALEDDAEDWFDRNDGTVVGGTFAPDGGLALDGDGDWVKLRSSLSRVLSRDASLAFFLGTTQTGIASAAKAPAVTGRVDSDGTDDAYWGWLDDTGRLRLSFGDGTGIQSPDPVNHGELHHYVLTRDAASGALVMYRDGVRLAAGTGPKGTKDGGGSYDRLGTVEGSSATLNGTLEDVQLFNHVLTADQVARLYGNAESGVAQATLRAPGWVGVEASFEAVAQGGETTTYQWDFGDGSSSAASTSRTASHTYASPGHYTVILTVTIGDRVQRYTFVRTVTYPRTSVAPTASSTIAGGGNLVYKVNPDIGTVAAIDRRGLRKVWESRVGKQPRTVALDTGGRAWVSVQAEDRLACLDTSGSQCGTIDTGYGSGPYGVAFVPGTDTGLVTLQGSGEVLRFDAATATVLARGPVNAEPRGIAITADGAHAYVTRLRSTAAGLVTRINASTLAHVSDIALQVDTTTVDAEDRARGKPNYLTQVVIAPDGRTAWAPSKQDNTLRGTHRDGSSLTHETTVRAIASVIDIPNARELFSRRIDFNDRSGAVAMAFSPLGDYVLVALQGSDSVAIVDAYSGAVKGALTGGTGQAPDGVWIDESAQRAFVSNFTTSSVAVYDISDALDSISFEPPLEGEADSVQTGALSAVELRGRKIFYNARDSRMSQDGYISCASCHLGGGEDGTVWDFTDRGEGLRNTIALNGRRGTALGRVHWTANFDEIQDFENDIRNAFGGAGFMTQADFDATSQPLGAAKAGRSADLDALAAYVTSLDDFGRSPYRTASGDMTAAATEGESLFTALNCQSCHSGASFTDQQRHDVGTIVASSGTGSGQPLAGTGFKTPTLLGVWRTAPYFHNGSAATLAAVVDSRHGGERAVTTAERDKLVAYLRSLDRVADPRFLTARFSGLPASHDGSTQFSFTLEFNLEVANSYRDFKNGVFELSGGAVSKARRVDPASDKRWEVTIEPGGNGPIVIVLPAHRDCTEIAAVCTPDGLRLSNRLAATVQGPIDQAVPPGSALTAAFENAPNLHDGSTTFRVRLRFSEEVAGLSYTAFNNGLLTVTGGTVGTARRLQPPSNVAWEFPVTPSGRADVVITLPAGRACTAQPTVCTSDKRQLSAAASVTIAGPDSAAPPDITSGTAFTVEEGETAVATLTAEDTDTEAGDLRWSIRGGADGAHFRLGVDGTLAFLAAKDYEAPDDAGSDGTYDLTVQVSDGTKDATAGVTVALANRNEAPTADAGRDREQVTEDATVTLLGRGTDPDSGDMLRYDWRQTGGPPVRLASSSGDVTTFLAPSGLSQATLLRFTLRVTDRGGLFDEDEVQVRVVPPAAPEVTGTTSYIVTEGETAVGTLTASDEDTPAGSLQWSITGGADRAHFRLGSDGMLAFLAAKDYEAPDDADSDGSYDLTVQVSDGTDSATAELSVTLANRNEAPVADAGPDQTRVAQGATVTLSGKGEDPDKDETLHYAWEQTGGPAVKLSAPWASVTTFVAPSGLAEDADLRFRFQVMDGEGLFDEDEVRVTVVATAAPEVTGTTSFRVTEGETAVGTLRASDPDTSASDLEWSIAGGTDSAHFEVGAGGMLAFLEAKDYEQPDDAGGDGTYDLTVQVSDGTSSATADLSVTLENRNEAPEADAGPDQTGIQGGSTVTLSGRGDDPDEGQTQDLSYAWTQTGGTSVTLSAPSAATTTFTAPSGLEQDTGLTFTLRVTDREGLFDEDEVQVTVLATAAPEVTGTTSFTVTEGETAVGTLAASDADTPSGDLGWSVTGGTDSAHFALSAGGALAFLAAKDYETPDDADSDGTYNLTVQVSDGTSSATGDISVALANRNEAPVADAGADQGDVGGGTTVTLSGSGEDPDAGDTLSYAWTQTGGTSVTLSAPAAAATTFTAPSGLEQDTGLTFTLRVTDREGLFDEDEVQVAVLAAPAAPEVTGTTSFTVTEGETAVGTLAASDEDTPAADLEWSITGGTDSSHFGLSAGGTLAFQAAKDYEAPDDAGSDGTYNLTVQVSDGTSSATGDISVALANRNEAPVADAGSDQSDIDEGTTVTLSGSGEDPDAGDTLSYAWTQTGGPAVTLSAAAAGAATFVAPSGLEQDTALRFTLRVTDREGLFDEDEVSVTVKRPALLTGSFVSLPATHRGQGTVVLRIQFSEPVATRFRTMRDRSLEVTNGQVQSARRVGGRRDLWEIVIAPSSIADIEVVLPATADCAAAGAVCTAAGKPLATRLAATIHGPDESELAVVSIAAVADSVSEGEPALFEVSRTGPAKEELTVQMGWTTSTKSRASSTTVRFPPGRKSVTVSWSRAGDEVVRDDLTVSWMVEEGNGYLVSADASSAQVVVKEGDVAAFVLTVDPKEIGEGESATVQVAITNGVTFADEQAISLGFGGSTAAKGADYTVSPEALTLPGGADSVRATVTALVDGDEEGDETVAITASRAGETIGAIAIVITGAKDTKDSELEPSGDGFSLAPENSRPSGIWSDGETAWVADHDDARLYAYRRLDGERDSAKDVATGPAPMGLWSDGETLWAAHLGGGLRAHRVADGTRQAWRDLALEANAAPAGVWSDGETAWVSEWLGDTVHAYRLTDGRRVASRDIRLAGGNLMPTGLWSDGETLWVADWSERLYAYDLSDGRRNPARDHVASGPDTDPTGLWSDGKTLLSTGWDDREVRAYRLPGLPASNVATGKGDGPGVPAQAASLPPITDPALRAAIAATLGKAPGAAVSPQELAGLETLDARNGGIRDLAGLERAVGLKQLDLGFNPLSDLWPLATLPMLESLNLDGAVPDLQALASLTGLKRLSVRSNGIDDLGALTTLTELTELDVGDNRIEELFPLAGLTALQVLRADRNRIADVWPLALLVELNALDLGSNRVHDLQALAGMSQLKTLRLGSNRLVELYPLSGLEGLSELDLAANAVEELSALVDMDGLRRLDLRGTAVGDLRPLRTLPSLVWVHVGGSRIEDLAPLEGLSGLTVAGQDDLQPPEAIGGGAGHASRD